MMLSIGYTCRIRDFVALFFFMFFLIATTMLFGWLNEVINVKEEDRDAWKLPVGARLQAHLLGYIPQLVAWLGVFFLFITNSLRIAMKSHQRLYMVLCSENWYCFSRLAYHR